MTPEYCQSLYESMANRLNQSAGVERVAIATQKHCCASRQQTDRVDDRLVYGRDDCYDTEQK
ncbi:hypothetical protein PPL_01356 [Heterostelium album PN500]|uniref:Uncharacterized protein n=1 Tax=Heterostelium pallidum (strain ATCC 26659 / Pp 5 / PN500) TaxID=670386 RepID=D3AZ16_HETP5|nr:hypothetical protein PPL_01356 [Heterostelium album PN500]EFA85573.1 hypothetical protein PPL_01356 [Heterostelium album PN500]|eukprot:XP_020437680.1 hypothetical protein PPL_01356 [Heterostelium album PN500]